MNLTWGLFAALYAIFATPIENAADGISGSLSTYLAGPMRLFMVVYLGIAGITLMLVPGNTSLNVFLQHIIRMGVFYVVASTTAAYSTYVTGVFLHALPTEITQAISGQLGGGAMDAGAFDRLWNSAYDGGLIVWKAIPVSMRGFGLQGLVVIYWLVAGIAIGAGFLIFVGSYLTLSLLIAVGPLFVAAAAFPVAQRYFWGWLSGVISAVLVQILAVLVLSVIITAEATMIAQMSASQAVGNIAAEGKLLVAAFLMFGLGTVMASRVSPIASGIAGGVYQNTSAYIGVATAPVMGAARLGASLLKKG